MDQLIDFVEVKYYHRQGMFHNHYHPVQNHQQLMLLMDLINVIHYNHQMVDVYQQHYHHIHHE